MKRSKWVSKKTIITTRRVRSGYVFLRVKDHPIVGTCQIAEHRLVMIEKLKRKLLPTEIVHHKNHSFKARSKNDPRLLKIVTRGEHSKIHKVRLGIRHSEEIKRKISASLKGRPSPTKGAKHTKDAIEKIKKAMRHHYDNGTLREKRIEQASTRVREENGRWA